ncbi:hypothetical protein [Celerinatantimonas sp. MCCC 1A17872]|uniref:hypothetical protein n=1 Tax=Celerinatantimonas sp. MCCC 1A17872 TaxID=3177514 RepID=UPI0038C93B6B
MELEQFAQTLMQDLRDYRKLAQQGIIRHPNRQQWCSGFIADCECMTLLEASRIHHTAQAISIVNEDNRA